MLVDSYERVVDYLRISVTQRCNFRCSYCMPQKPLEWMPKEDLLSYEQLFNFVKVAIDNGVTKIRITGGEPTVRGDLDQFIAMIKGYKSDIDLALTTNGFLLWAEVAKLAQAGLDRVNISLDTLDREKFLLLTKKDALKKVLKGINAALEAGVKVKLNSVIMKDINDDEIISLYEFAKQKKIEIRFIEFMENESANSSIKTVRADTLVQTITTKYALKQLVEQKHSAAKPYIDEDGYRFGIIEPYDDSFCQTCNRIRLSAQGDIIPCLYYEDSQNIKDIANDPKHLEKRLKEVIKNKPQKNRWSFDTKEFETSSRAFYFTGG